MNILLIDNVNNLSGAPVVARSIAAWLRAPIFCIRQTQEPAYNAAACGTNSEQRRKYFSGIFGLLFSTKLWSTLTSTRVVICNTCLTFPFAVLARLLGKQVICVIHESASKNILYRVALFASKWAAHRIITPSRLAYQDVGIPEAKWQVIPNSLSDIYSEPRPSADSNAAEIYILFVGGGRAYKGEHLFRAIGDHCRNRLPNLHLHAVGDEAFIRLHGNSLKLTPQIYRQYHFVFILTDNRVWKETFGLVGCEAAACRCLPLFTDRFAYAELWSEFTEQLYLPTYEAAPIVKRLEKLLQNRESLENLRNSACQHALHLTDSQWVAGQWREVVKSTESVAL